MWGIVLVITALIFGGGGGGTIGQAILPGFACIFCIAGPIMIIIGVVLIIMGIMEGDKKEKGGSKTDAEVVSIENVEEEGGEKEKKEPANETEVPTQEEKIADAEKSDGSDDNLEF